MADKASCCSGVAQCDSETAKSSACGGQSSRCRGQSSGYGGQSSGCGGQSSGCGSKSNGCGAKNRGCAAESSAVQDSVKEYYGKELKTRDDCQSGINCKRSGRSLPGHVQRAFDLVHPDVTLRYFGCGPVIPEALEGCKVLDLGSGSGRDCFAVSKLIGPSGHVIGVDMTEEQLDYARGFLEHHKKAFGYSQSNVEFRLGYIERLTEAGIPADTFDLVISNCVICLCQNKAAVLAQACEVLKVGGEMYFSDMYTDKQVSDFVKNDHVMWGEGLGGALQWTELYRLAEGLAFSRPRVVTATRVDTAKFDQHLDGARYVSVTYRLFKLPPGASPGASTAVYRGGMEGSEESFALDHATVFPKGEPVVVDPELAAILTSSRFSKYFRLEPVPDGSDVTAHLQDPKVDPILLAEQLDSGSKTSKESGTE